MPNPKPRKPSAKVVKKTPSTKPTSPSTKKSPGIKNVPFKV